MFISKHLTNLYRKLVRIEEGKMKRRRRNVRGKSVWLSLTMLEDLPCIHMNMRFRIYKRKTPVFYNVNMTEPLCQELICKY